MEVEVWVEFDRKELTKALFPEGVERPNIAIIDLNKAEAVNTQDGKVRIKLKVEPSTFVGFVNSTVGGRLSSEDKYIVRHAHS